MAVEAAISWLPWFQMVARHPAKRKRVSGGRGILKTTHGVQWLTMGTIEHPRPGVGLCTMNTYRQAKRVAWPEVNGWMENLAMGIRSDGRKCKPLRLKVSENATELSVRLVGGGPRELRFIGMDNYDDSRGIHPVKNLNDEVAKSKLQGFTDVIEPANANHDADELDITTPRKGWWKHRFDEGWPGSAMKEADAMSWKIRADEVGMISRQKLEHFRARMSPALYAQEWEGEFTSAEGPIFPEFIAKPWTNDRPEGHLVAPGLARQQMKEGGHLIGALDWARVGRAVMLWIWVTRRGGVIVLDEMVVSNVHPAQMVTQMRARAKDHYPVPTVTILDAQCWATGDLGHSTAQLFQSAGLRVTKADKRFDPSIQKIRQLMTIEMNDAFPSFAIVNGTCPNLVDELDILQEEDVKSAGGGFRDKVDCDCTDALRYGIMAVRESPPAEMVSRPRGPLPGNPFRQGPHVDRITGFDRVTGNPIWEGVDG